MAGTQEYDINSLLGAITSAPGSSPVVQNQPQEYNINDLLTGLQPYQEQQVQRSTQPVVLKGAEYFARGGIPGGFASNVPNLVPEKQARDFGKATAAFLDNTIGAVLPYGAKQIGYLFGRTIGDSPETANAISTKMASIIDKPFGKAFGISDDPQYKGEATTKLMEFVGNNVDKGSDWISKQTGLPKSDIEWMINTAMPKVVEKGAGIISKGTGSAVSQITSQYEKAKANLEKPSGAKEQINKQFENIVYPEEIKPSVALETPKAGEVAPTEIPTIEIKGVGQVEAPKPMETTKPVEIAVPEENPPMRAEPMAQPELAGREQLLRDVGVENIRRSALEGNHKEASSQFITSKAEKGVYGEGMKEQIAHEKNALEGHFGGVESELGGTVPRKGTGFEVTDEIERGKTVKNALEDAQKTHANETKRLYDDASKQYGEVPVDLTDFKSFLDRKSNFPKDAGRALRGDVVQYLKDFELLNEDGSVKPMTVKQSEGLRQYINSQYGHETKSAVGDLVNAIDQDVFKNVKGDTFEQARAHFKAGKEIYDNPKAMKDLLKDEGVNQKVADEKVMNKISTLDESQFGHLMNTLRDTGKTQAIAEIQTNLVNRIKEAGKSEVGEPWNSRAAAKERAKLSEKLRVAFADNPEVLSKIDKGIEAGNILYIPSKYPGAAVQTHLLHSKFADFILQKTPTAVGGWLGGGAGALGGEWVGQKISNKASQGRQLQQLEKDINYQSGKNKPSDFGIKP